ncbi:MAG: Do family serine endopeptidase [Proteobacteria bacterium]|nr:Do family serine endopeptidase [Pseudomonadota bacterium]
MMKHSQLFCGILLLITAPFALAKSDTAPASLAPILEKAMPAVVNISVQGEVNADSLLPPATPPQENNDEKGDNNGAQNNNPPPPTPPQASGKGRKFKGFASGVIVDSDKGYLMTNAHTVKDATVITVKLNDGRSVQAKLIGSDPASDIAVLQIKASNLRSLPLADSNKLKVGDFVVAIGNPFNLDYFGTNQTATYGIISALHRSDLNIEGVENFIQTDAAINPGNSGGALVNMNGELIGINTAILSPYGGNIGIGFAIPINMARDVMQQLIKYGSIHRGLMGIYVQQFTPELAEAFGGKDMQGALVTQVNPASPADKAGLKPGDLIQVLNGTKIETAAQVRNMIQLLRVGTTVTMQILRQGKQLTLTAATIDAKQNQNQQQMEDPFLFGLALMDFVQESPIHGHVKGIQIVGATENSFGARAGVLPGDVIIAANGKTVNTISELKQASKENHNQLLLHILRGPGALYLVIK